MGGKKDDKKGSSREGEIITRAERLPAGTRSAWDPLYVLTAAC